MLKLILPIIISLLFTTKVFGETHSYSYYDEDDILNEEYINFEGEYEEEFKLWFLIYQLIESEKNYIPENTKLLGIKINKKYAELNFSKEILNYGGTSYEVRLINQIVDTSINFPNINYVTILVDGELVFLPEGTQVFTMNKILNIK